MPDNENLFSNNVAYDCAIGRWSRVVGGKFLDWLEMPAGLHWLDIGCGTGAFAELILEHNAPAAVSGIDPSEGQIAYARQRPLAGRIDYRRGDAMSMPYGDDAFDLAVMALVVQYIPDPAKAMSEIVRVIRPGGTVAAYTWTCSPGRPMMEAFRSIGVEERRPPSDHLRSLEKLTDLFASAGLVHTADSTIEITVDYDTFNQFWASQATMALTRSPRQFSEAEIEKLKSILQERLETTPHGPVSYTAQANAVRGSVST
jgi:ubiquinone/menaquinone biosynthesis C-methylase UbiE